MMVEFIHLLLRGKPIQLYAAKTVLVNRSFDFDALKHKIILYFPFWEQLQQMQIKFPYFDVYDKCAISFLISNFNTF